jgi:hypothetical protein
MAMQEEQCKQEQHELYILTNTDYGGFTINIELLCDFFKYSVITGSNGQKLFNQVYDVSIENYDIKPFFINVFESYFFLYAKNMNDDFSDNSMIYNPDIIWNRTGNKFYQLSEWLPIFRNNKYFIDFLFKQVEQNLTYDKFYNLLAEFIIDPNQSFFDMDDITFCQKINCEISDSYQEIACRVNNINKCSIFTNEGKYYIKYIKRHDLPDPQTNYYVLSITYDNWTSNNNLTSFIVTTINQISDMRLNKLKPGYNYTIHEYDGVESIKFTLDYKTIISALLLKLKLNNITSDVSDPEFVQKLMECSININDM